MAVASSLARSMKVVFGRGRQIAPEGLADLEQLRLVLQSEEEGDISPARLVDNLGKIFVREGRELIHDDADKWMPGAATGLGVAPPDHQLQVLKQYPAEGFDGRFVDICVETEVEDQPLVDHLVHGDDVVVGAGDVRHFLRHEGHQVIDQPLDLWDTVLVVEGCGKVVDTHAQRSPLLGRSRKPVHVGHRGLHPALQFGDIVGHDENVVKVEAAAGVVQDADEVFEINALVRIEELVGVHLEGIEDERHLIFRARPRRGPKRVVESGKFGMLGIDQAKLVRSTSRVYGRQESSGAAPVRLCRP